MRRKQRQRPPQGWRGELFPKPTCRSRRTIGPTRWKPAGKSLTGPSADPAELGTAGRNSPIPELTPESQTRDALLEVFSSRLR
jgi:hypothetical protein